MREWTAFGFVWLSIGACTPCTSLNDVVVEAFKDCDFGVPEDLRDGGYGSCGADRAEGACHEACWEAADCRDIWQLEENAEGPLLACIQACE